MRIFTRLVQTLKGSGPEPEPIAAPIGVGGSIAASQTCTPIVTREDFEFLRTLRMLHKFGPSHSYGLKIFQGRLSFDGRVICGRCVSRRCFDCPQLVAAKEGFSLFGCDRCRDFLIRTLQSS